MASSQRWQWAVLYKISRRIRSQPSVNGRPKARAELRSCHAFHHPTSKRPDALFLPLPLNGSLTWHRVGVSNAGGASIWRTNLCVKNIPEGHILVPSYVCTEKGYQYQWQARTEAANQTSVLLPIGPAQADSWTGFVPAKDDAHALQSKIDCWHSRSNIEELDLQLTLYIPNSDTLPNRDLLTLCIRPVDQQTCRLPYVSIRCCGAPARPGEPNASR